MSRAINVGSFKRNYQAGVADVPDDDLICGPRISADLDQLRIIV